MCPSLYPASVNSESVLVWFWMTSWHGDDRRQLPWVHVKYLASSVLALAARRMQLDWLERHNFRPVLLETCVDHRLYPGTCYKAANWIYVGDNQGRGKLDRYELRDKPIKAIFLYPLAKDFRAQLTAIQTLSPWGSVNVYRPFVWTVSKDSSPAYRPACGQRLQCMRRTWQFQKREARRSAS